MPVFNGEKYISEAIKSVLNQSHSNLELLIIDDGSKDATLDIVNKFNDERIKYFRQENEGVSAARNVGLKNVCGEFLCFLDADDILPKDSIHDRLVVFKNDVNFVDGRVEYVDSTNTNVLGIYQPVLDGVNPRESLLKIDGKCFMGVSWMIRTSILKSYFKVGLSHCEDLLFLIENTIEGNYKKVDSVVLRYRQQNNSAMTNLIALELGYLTCKAELNKNSSISEKSKEAFRRKSRSIMFKSFFKKGMFMSAFRTLFKFKK